MLWVMGEHILSFTNNSSIVLKYKKTELPTC